MKGFFIKTPNGSWFPHDEDTRKYCDRRNVGQVLVAEVKMARSYPNHRRFFDFRNASTFSVCILFLNTNLVASGNLKYKRLNPCDLFCSSR